MGVYVTDFIASCTPHSHHTVLLYLAKNNTTVVSMGRVTHFPFCSPLLAIFVELYRVHLQELYNAVSFLLRTRDRSTRSVPTPTKHDENEDEHLTIKQKWPRYRHFCRSNILDVLPHVPPYLKKVEIFYCCNPFNLDVLLIENISCCAPLAHLSVYSLACGMRYTLITMQSVTCFLVLLSEAPSFTPAAPGHPALAPRRVLSRSPGQLLNNAVSPTAAPPLGTFSTTVMALDERRLLLCTRRSEVDSSAVADRSSPSSCCQSPTCFLAAVFSGRGSLEMEEDGGEKEKGGDWIILSVVPCAAAASACRDEFSE